MSEATTYRNALPLQSMLQEYRLDSVLGAGGFGITYLGWDTHLEKHLAIKEYLPIELSIRALDGSVVPVTTDSEENYKWGLDRFILEARTLAKFSHPHIVRVNRYFEANGTGYMVMDYEKGESLSETLKRMPQPDEARLKNILMPLLDGLQAVHGSGFLHRDIKPANIFIRENGSPVLLDFGAARHAIGGATKSLTAVLTPGFAPLEQYSGDGHQGPWSDIYAMSGVLYRALTNDNPPDAVTRIRADMVPQALNAARARYSGPFIKAIEWALAVDESQRPQSVAEWRRALQGERLAPPVGPALVNSAAAAPATLVPARQQDAAQAVAGKGKMARPRRDIRMTPLEPESRGGGWRILVLVACVVLAVGAVGAWKKRSDDKQAAVEKLQAEKRAADLREAREEADRAAADRRAAEQREAELRAGEPRAAREEPERRPEPRAAQADFQRYLAERRAEEERAREKFAAPSPMRPEEFRPPPPEAFRDRPPRERDERPGQEEIEQFRRKFEADFRAIDGNSDGYLSREEASARPQLAKEFQRIDLDGDGRISPQELMQFRKEMFMRFRKQ